MIAFPQRLHLVAPPWIKAAHIHGVRVLGTLIFEWDEGSKDLLHLIENSTKCVASLANLADHFGFDGWLLNVECTLDRTLITRIYEFILALRAHCKVIWYDSLTCEGNLKYQNALTALNHPFLHCSDAIFLNYHWQPPLLATSTARAGARRLDVYAGVDVWGRGTWGNGRLRTSLGASAAQEMGLSVALFAPAWTWESDDAGRSERYRFEQYENLLWGGLVDGEDLFLNAVWREENGGDGWATLPPDRKVGIARVSSHQWCRRKTSIELKQVSLLRLRLWVRGTPPNCADPFYVRVRLYNKDGLVCDVWELEHRTTAEEWTLLSHIWDCLTEEVVRLEYEHGGLSAEHWAGHYGAAFSEPSLHEVVMKQRILSSRVLLLPPAYVRPFAANFSLGCGPLRWVKGRPVGGQWSHMSEQGLLPNCTSLLLESQHLIHSPEWYSCNICSF